MNSPSLVPCPTCHQVVVWNPQNRYRPFCSQRCQLIDLGEWATEQKSIPGKETPTYSETLLDQE
ncbi:MAG: DNA gyrase inhibitor YacG [Candidatus Symbiodolus clandestinus]